MNRTWSLAFCLLLLGSAWGAGQEARKPIADGRFLQDVDGRLVHDDVNDIWRLDLTVEVNAPGAQIPAGTELTLLPSATLAGMIEDANDRILPLYRLGVIVTQYRGRNYLLPTHYLALSRLKESGAAPQGPGGQMPATRVEPNTAFPLPGAIAEELKKRQPLRAQQRPTSSPAPTAPAKMLVDVVGFIEERQGRIVFVPDALGLNVSKTEYVLLPNAILEQAQRLQAASPDRLRFSIAGQVSEFKGKQYLLLQRAIRMYSFGDFTG